MHRFGPAHAVRRHRSATTGRKVAMLGAAMTMVAVSLPSAVAGAQQAEPPSSRSLDAACPGDYPNAFSDDDGSVLHDAINCLADYGITRGTADGDYEPGGDVTRGEMAAFIVRFVEDITGVELPTGTDVFTDDNGGPFEPDINKLATAKVVAGRLDGNYQPDSRVTRAEMAKFIASAVDLIDNRDTDGSQPPDGTPGTFPDVGDGVFSQFINALAEQGIVGGFPNGNYRPGSQVTRDQMAAFIMRAYDYAVADGSLDVANQLRLVGQSDLGGDGLNGPVAVAGDTAIVGAGDRQSGGLISRFYNPVPCPQVSTKIVDLSDPTDPRVAAEIPAPVGTVAADVDILTVDTPAFTGDLAAIALVACTFEGNFVDRGVQYYDVTDPDNPTKLGFYFPDAEQVPPEAPPCGPDEGAGCANSEHSVSLVQRPDGTVLSLSTLPFASASDYTTGDARIVDVTDPTNPTQVESWPIFDQTPEGYGEASQGFSNNGCRPFDGGRDAVPTRDGASTLVSWQDFGLYEVGLGEFDENLEGTTNPPLIGHWTYDRDDRSVEGNAANIGVGRVSGRDLALLADEDWNPVDTVMRIDTPASSDQGLSTGEYFACEAVFSLFDPEQTAQIYGNDGNQVPAGAGSSGQFVYAGRGCPVNADFGTEIPDPYLNVNGEPVDVTGKIVVLDRSAGDRQFRQIPNPENTEEMIPDPDGAITNRGSGCAIAEKAQRAQDEGAVAVVLDAVFGTGQSFGPDGIPRDLAIPVVGVDNPAVTQLRDTLCPEVDAPASGICTSTTEVTGALVDKPAQWGGLRIIDRTDPSNPTQSAEFRTANTTAIPTDLGSYSARRAVTRGSLAFAAWNSDGLRVVDLSDPANPTEVDSFVPADSPDTSATADVPAGTLPDKALVTGVAAPRSGLVVITDVNSGLYVFELVP